MKITILTYGSAGDVVPYISLALGLMERNHEIILAAPQNFEPLVKEHGIPYMPLYGNTQTLVESEQGRKWMAAGDTKSFFKELSTLFYSIRLELQRDVMAACKDSQAIIIGTLMINYGTTASEKLNIPYLMAVVNPVCVSTRAFPYFVVTHKSLPFGFLNALTYKLAFKAYGKQTESQINEWRKQIGLQPLKSNVIMRSRKMRVPVLHGYSPHLLPKPKDWESNHAVTGIWKAGDIKKSEEKPSEEFSKWLQAGIAPVYFGFGSMPVLNPNEIQQMISEICLEMGIRAIINAGWSRFEEKPHSIDDSVYLIRHADFEWLFPQCSVIVHHGGVGTTHLSLESGVPTLICSIFADNPMWGERLERMKIGRHIQFRDLDKNKIIKAIRSLQNDEVRKRAKEIANKIKMENGLKTAVDLIEYYLPHAPVFADI
jgi:UDP:flavonoid glycosyltransferase YjiC (YdhE family)